MLVCTYLRVTRRMDAGGSVVRYVALAHNERAGGQTRARVLRGLGREDGLDTDGLRRLVSRSPGSWATRIRTRQGAGSGLTWCA